MDFLSDGASSLDSYLDSSQHSLYLQIDSLKSQLSTVVQQHIESNSRYEGMFRQSDEEKNKLIKLMDETMKRSHEAYKENRRLADNFYYSLIDAKEKIWNERMGMLGTGKKEAKKVFKDCACSPICMKVDTATSTLRENVGTDYVVDTGTNTTGENIEQECFAIANLSRPSPYAVPASKSKLQQQSKTTFVSPIAQRTRKTAHLRLQ
jgi:hypothetical protein